MRSKEARNTSPVSVCEASCVIGGALKGNSWRTESSRHSLFPPNGDFIFGLGLFKMMFLRDKDWAQVVKTNHYLPHHYLTLVGRVRREKRVSAQAKPISEVVKEFEQSLENLRPSTRRVYVAAAKTAIRSAHLELWQCPSTGELLASLGAIPHRKEEYESLLS